MDASLHHGRARERRAVAAPVARLALLVAQLAVALLVLIAAAGCETGAQRARKAHLAALHQPLGQLADQNDVEAARVVADIEVLRAQSVFSDSAANALIAMPANAFLTVDAKGQPLRVDRGQDITELLAFTAVEPAMLKEKNITPNDAAEVRRLAVDNIAAAAEKAKQFRMHRRTGLP